MKVLMIEPGKAPYTKEINPGLESLQHEVGGDIEPFYPSETDAAAYIMNDEGKVIGLPLNRGLFDEGAMYDIISGPFLVVGTEESTFGSLSDELILKYTELFRYPEVFVRLNGQIQCIRLKK